MNKKRGAAMPPSRFGLSAANGIRLDQNGPGMDRGQGIESKITL